RALWDFVWTAARHRRFGILLLGFSRRGGSDTKIPNPKPKAAMPRRSPNKIPKRLGLTVLRLHYKIERARPAHREASTRFGNVRRCSAAWPRPHLRLGGGRLPAGDRRDRRLLLG